MIRKNMANSNKLRKTKENILNKGDDSSSPSSKMENLIEQKHQQIAEGASRIMIEKGYHTTTIREIAKACDMSMGQLYHYISTKDDVLYFVFEEMQKLWFDQMQQAGIEQLKDPVERLRKALDHTIRFSAANKKLVQFIFTESKSLDKKHLRSVLKMEQDKIISYWRNMLSEIDMFKQNEKEVDFAACMIEYIILYLPLRAWGISDRPQEENINSLVEFTMRGIGL